MGSSVLAEVDPSRRQSLRYFNLFRLILAGLFVVVGGQHRAHAGALRRIPAVPAMIVPMDLIEQASAFQ